MPNSEMKILRDKLAKAIAEIKMAVQRDEEIPNVVTNIHTEPPMRIIESSEIEKLEHVPILKHRWFAGLLTSTLFLSMIPVFLSTHFHPVVLLIIFAIIDLNILILVGSKAYSIKLKSFTLGRYSDEQKSIG